jgi:hypothetical protein
LHLRCKDAVKQTKPISTTIWVMRAALIKGIAHSLLAVGKFDVGSVADSVPVKGLDNGGEARKSSEHSTRVNW